ncbi:uncharacterized protein ACA1_374040 [Acanthamoeba castellanii str. Neff]|uniref:Retrovirus-related Pol polyprotein from transposon TNT 1-94-like beta-barrel domain-containing protein n=1 Tax=Acanthamoeba castellanii (strain ATCC 30010 / Neff) TaxID=1257118 RepID=L8GH68_ACACF|nr:uncharacterized protein ACA1_374040 [Acanthamoeba castellanii str. Neff]ELR12337.1 hypothetical protein ACA1_374040 [Acanthamoeba castellanii str. Neff]
MQTAGLIQLSLRRHFHLTVKQHKNDLKRMMEVLDEQFKPKANTSKLDMLMQLTNIKCNCDEDLDSYFGHIDSLAGELEANSLKLPKIFILMVTLNSLPSNYNPVQTVINSNNDITIVKAQKMLHNQEALLHTRGDHIESANYMAKQRRRGKGQPHGYNHSSHKEKKRKPIQNKELKCYQCGATCHVTCNQDWLHNYVDLTSKSHNLILSNNFKCHIHGYGTLHTTTHVDGGKRKVTFQKVLYTLELAKNLLSTAHITSKGCQLTINTQGCQVNNHQG